MAMSTQRHRNRSTPPVIAAAFLIAAIIAGCSSTNTSKVGTTEKGTTGATVSGATAASSPAGATDTPGSAVTDASGEPEVSPMVSYFEPTNESFVSSTEFMGDGPFVMLNLFRLKDVPDFSNHPEMKPETPVTSRELFYRYIAYMDSNLDKVGAKRIFLADSGPLLIGPAGEHWDVVQMVQYPSKQSFIDLAILIRPELLKREVMLADSRIMPMREKPLNDPYNVD